MEKPVVGSRMQGSGGEGRDPAVSPGSRPRSSLAALLRSHRQAAGLTQEELAERSALSVRTISDLERGVYRTARKDTALLIADALCLSDREREHFLAVAGGRGIPGASGTVVPRFTGPPVLLFGREASVVTICSLLRRPQVRLLSLIGPGGVGKTRLAVEVVTRLTPEWPEPPIFIPLEGIQNADLVIPTVGRALGVRDGPERGAVEAVLEALERRRPLLVLDNFEHLVEAALALETVVESCPGATVLVTSRVRLQVRGEQVVEVATLPVPAEGESDSEALRRCPSVQLFIDRCEAVAGVSAAPTGGQLVAVGEICRRLDGLPLALELAAARSRLFGVEGIRTHLGHLLDLLTGGPRDLPQRQQALRATIEWSYRLLTAACQELLERVAVFAGGFSFDAAVVVSGCPSVQVGESLGALVDASLIGHLDTDTGESRLRLLQTVQDFGLERLAVSPDRDQVYLRHARFFADLAEASDRALRGGAQAHWMRVLDQERDNLRMALTTATTRGYTEEALRLSGGLWLYWDARGDLVEGRRWLRSALALAGGSPALRARALKVAGNLAHTQADLDAAERYYTEAMALFAEAGSTVDVAVCHNNLGNVALARADPDTAIAYFEEGLRLLASSTEERTIAILEENLGRVVAQHDPERAVELLTRSLARQELVGDERTASWVRSDLGTVLLLRGDLQRAEENLRSALLVQTAQGDRVGLCTALEGLAAVAAERGSPRRAALLLGAAETIRELIGSPVTCDQPAYHRAFTAIQGELDEATLRAAWAEGRSMPFGHWVEVTSDQGLS
jgi:predicted ATPase/DNA-binding XRE family transcriptional regulator